jgi:probable phosphoglycerate mutase
MTTFILVRHALTDDVARALSGTARGILLNAAGHAQAAAVAERLTGVALSAIVSSPLERAGETARAIAHHHRLEVQAMPAFGELEFGGWTGQSIQALAGDEGWRRFNSARSLARPPSGELMLDVQQRGMAALLDLHERFPAGTVVIVSHGDVIRAILLYCLGMPIDFVHRLEVSPARISIVEMDADGARVLQVNGDSATAIP